MGPGCSGSSSRAAKMPAARPACPSGGSGLLLEICFAASPADHCRPLHEPFGTVFTGRKGRAIPPQGAGADLGEQIC